ncbi:hypothetical protein [Stenotrophomonas sp. OVS01A]|jgi:hypothetical protein|uniref:hypothetical protein n=1 Tax=Stenotrophomonas TaxID=40323 RepID=UPI00066E40FF|nr:hypothetical protein [Stenotrophomonas sp. OVS01A]HDS1139595.1 hypothetical protein [Stenotrophomonas maltophilia]
MTFATRNVGAARAGIAILILFLIGMGMAAMLAVAIPEGNKDAFLMLIGGLNTAMGGIIQFYFNIGRRGAGA